jgi:hypothetical protein
MRNRTAFVILLIMELLTLLFLPRLAQAQTISYVTATGTVAAGYSNGTMTAVFQAPANSSQFSYLNEGFPLSQTATISGSGTWTLNLADTSTLQPTGSQWRFFLCSQQSYTAAPTCFVTVMPVTCVNNVSCSGSTLNLSSSFTAAPAPPVASSNAADKSATTVQAFNGPITAPQLLVSKTFTVTPQTIRGIVVALSGQSTANGSAFLDIFPNGYNPWGAGIVFEDYATNHLANFNSGAINLGLADNSNNSQAICFTAARSSTFDTVFCLWSTNGRLNWNANGDALTLGSTPTSSSDSEYGFAARVGWDATNNNAILSAGGSNKSTGVGAALGAGDTLGATYFFFCDPSGNCGVGTQKTNATLDPFYVDNAGNVKAVKTVRTGSSTNTDLAGALTLASGTATFTFTGTYVTAPICVATDTTAAAAVKVSATTTVLTITGTGTDAVNYICTGRT